MCVASYLRSSCFARSALTRCSWPECADSSCVSLPLIAPRATTSGRKKKKKCDSARRLGPANTTTTTTAARAREVTIVYIDIITRAPSSLVVGHTAELSVHSARVLGGCLLLFGRKLLLLLLLLLVPGREGGRGRGKGGAPSICTAARLYRTPVFGTSQITFCPFFVSFLSGKSFGIKRESYSNLINR